MTGSLVGIEFSVPEREIIVSPTQLSREEPGTRWRADREIVYLVAPGGGPNYGDEFILRAWLRHLERVRPEAEIVVDCHTPGQAAVLFPSHPRVTFVDTIWRICDQTRGLGPAEVVALAGDVVGEPSKMPRILTGIELLARAHTLHLIGGGYINEVWSHHLALLATAAAVAEMSNGRVIATGQGLLPIGDRQRFSLVRELQARFELFDVRDGPSSAAIEGSGGNTSFTCDDAWLGIGDDGVFDTTSEAAGRDFVLCLQSDLMEDFGGGLGTDGLTKAVTVLIEQWNLSGDEVAVVEGIPGHDRVVFDQVAHLLPGAAFVPFTSVWRHGLPARSGQTWVSTRFHPHLLAAATGASGLALSGRSDYYSVKHQSLVDGGSHWRVTDSITDLPSSPVRNGGFSAHDVEMFSRQKSAQADRIYPPMQIPKLHRALGKLGIGKRA